GLAPEGQQGRAGGAPGGGANPGGERRQGGALRLDGGGAAEAPETRRTASVWPQGGALAALEQRQRRQRARLGLGLCDLGEQVAAEPAPFGRRCGAAGGRCYSRGQGDCSDGLRRIRGVEPCVGIGASERASGGARAGRTCAGRCLPSWPDSESQGRDGRRGVQDCVAWGTRDVTLIAGFRHVTKKSFALRLPFAALTFKRFTALLAFFRALSFFATG
ncbi:unnamed protein product, partial [Effrenium voratum]